MDHETRLQISNLSSHDVGRLDDIFGSVLVDVAYLDEITEDGCFLIPDSETWPEDDADFNWLCEVVSLSLHEYRIYGARFSLAPRKST